VRDLRGAAAALGLPVSGRKAELTDRIAAHLAGTTPPARTRSRGVDGLRPPLRLDTVVPPGQRMTAELQAFMVEHCGPQFRFDRHMREFFAGDGADGVRTLADALDTWHETRGETTGDIEPQFRYNRFVRGWRAAHPRATHADVVAAWHAHRGQPAD
jgi:hypothetical protein